MRRFIFLLVIALVAGACGDDGPLSGVEDGDPTTSQPTAPEPDSSLDVEGEWELAGGTLDGAPFPLVDGWRVTMFLDDGMIGGTAACNGYGGRYDTDGSSITLTEWSITEMGCQPDVMESEQAFLSVLQKPLTLSRTGDELAVTGEGFDLQFTKIEPIATAALIGTVWELHTIVQGDAATRFIGEASLILDPDGTFTASTGCRQVDGTYLITGDELLFPDMAATGECPADQTDQDNAVISVLESARVEIDGDQLRLLSSGGEGLQYSAVDG